VDEEIARILNKMLAKDPADRYQSCEELNNDLKKHPLVIQDGQLKLRPAPWAGPNSSNPTVVGAPTPLTPGVSPRASTPPPVVSSSRGPGQAAPTPAPQARQPITAEVAAPAVNNRYRNLLVVAGVVMLAAAGWIAWSGMLGNAPAAPAVAVASPAAPAVPTPPAPGAPPTATAVDAATGLPESDPVVSGSVDGAVDPGLAPGAGALDTALGTAEPIANIRYGHGGPNQSPRNRVRARMAKEPSAAELAQREAARRQAEEAALAALQAQAAPVVVQTAAPVETAEQAKIRKSFRCRVFKKCDPPKPRKGRNAEQAAPTPTVAAPATSAETAGGN
jgi:serine/threonine-protein kinase